MSTRYCVWGIEMQQPDCMSQVEGGNRAGDPVAPLFSRGLTDRCMPDKTSLFPRNQRRGAVIKNFSQSPRGL